jgi:F-type H+-transporting ATPase subunit b
MLIDWFTVGAQVFNFLILVWLMKRFLYQPVLDAIDAREKRIASELADAAQKQAQADQERDAFKQKNADFDQQREALARKARTEVDAERQRLLTEARTAADAMQCQRHDALESELKTLQKDIARRSQEEVFSITRKVLTDLAGTTLEDRMVEVFCQRLRALDANAQGELAKALQASPGTLRVRSAFELTPAQHTAIEKALDATMGATASIAFETAPAVISGIELSTNGWKIAWNIAEFLTSLEHSIRERMDPIKGSAAATP